MMNVNYLGGYANINGEDTKLQYRLKAFMETTELLKVDDCLVDVANLFDRHFMCCRENCDFYIHCSSGDNRKLFDNKVVVEYVDKCCCQGGSLELPEDLIATIDANIDGIVKLCDPQCAEQINKKGWKRSYKEGGERYTCVGYLRKDHRCLFTFISEDGMPMCALHRYALNKGEDILKYKPFECYMYPLEFIEVDDKVVITSVDNRGTTQGFLRWGDVHVGQACQCKTHNGIPMYQYGKEVIESVVGKSTYKKIDAAYKNWKERQQNG